MGKLCSLFTNKILERLGCSFKALFGLLHTINYYFPCAVRPKMGWGQEPHSRRQQVQRSTQELGPQSRSLGLPLVCNVPSIRKKGHKLRNEQLMESLMKMMPISNRKLDICSSQAMNNQTWWRRVRSQKQDSLPQVILRVLLASRAFCL